MPRAIYPLETLFDAGSRHRLEAKPETESNYHYLNTSSRPICAQARITLESWFTAFPPDGKSHLRTRFRSDDERQFAGAFFELYCHALLAHQGFEVEVHPDLGNDQTKRPDFKGMLQGRPVFYLESVAARSRNPDREDGLARIYNAVESVKSHDFVLDVVVRGNVLSPTIRKRRIQHELRTWLASLDLEKVTAACTTEGMRNLPVGRIGGDDWTIECTPFPRRHYEVSEGRLIAVRSYVPKSTFVDMQQPMLKRLREKAKRYKDVDLPYIVAINIAEEFVDTDESVAALFGSPAVAVNRVTHEATMTWLPNGLWTGPRGQNTRVSAVLAVSLLGPYTIAHEQPVLWHNPWASKPVAPELWQGHQMLADQDSGTMVRQDGKPIHEILRLVA